MKIFLLSLFLLSLLLYSQNFLLSFLSSSYFEPNILEFILIFFTIVFLQTFKYRILFLMLWQTLYTVQLLFISYFGSSVQSYDIYLFLTHFTETFESFIPLLLHFSTILLLSFALILCILFLSKELKYSKLLLLLPILSLLYFNDRPYNDLSIKLLHSLSQLDFSKNPNISKSKKTKPIVHTPKNLNIVVVLAESMRSKNLSLFGYDKNTTPLLNSIEPMLFKSSIYSGATNTDVSVPLFLNGAIDTHTIDLSNNLFTLASSNTFQTHFI
ncbi:MAG: sulfatase-like hydrolase/transferase, partial [Campylobacterota bacterium]|nr:sulfatase-like hydrolase/transferase [Campylobacterota bacterium]